MTFENIPGVPRFVCEEYAEKRTAYCLLIPIINEGDRIIQELQTAQAHGVDRVCDIIICDGGSTDGCIESQRLKCLGVSALLIKQDTGKQGVQLRMGFWWALQRGYTGFITIDGNNKDSIEDVPAFVQKLNEGYDLVQGSRFIKGGKAINTPPGRYLSVRLLHAPVISLTARHWFTDTTNAYRAYSKRYIEHPHVQIFRPIFETYELLAYLSVRATQLGLKACELPVCRFYPKHGKTPTKISPLRGNWLLLSILFRNLRGKYNA